MFTLPVTDLYILIQTPTSPQPPPQVPHRPLSCLPPMLFQQVLPPLDPPDFPLSCTVTHTHTHHHHTARTHLSMPSGRKSSSFFSSFFFFTSSSFLRTCDYTLCIWCILHRHFGIILHIQYMSSCPLASCTPERMNYTHRMARTLHTVQAASRRRPWKSPRCCTLPSSPTRQTSGLCFPAAPIPQHTLGSLCSSPCTWSCPTPNTRARARAHTHTPGPLCSSPRASSCPARGCATCR